MLTSIIAKKNQDFTVLYIVLQCTIRAVYQWLSSSGEILSLLPSTYLFGPWEDVNQIVHHYYHVEVIHHFILCTYIAGVANFFFLESCNLVHL